MKRLILGILVICLFFCLTKNAFADSEDTYINIYTVGSSSSELKKTTFGWDEKPWLFLELPDIVYNWVEAYSPAFGIDPVINQGSKIWLSFSDERWADFKEEGDWLISSAALFLLGGGHC
ncbi:MAG: hypothetical protein ABIH18_01185 [Candidatus Omnitrophota bacterium]